MSFLDSRPERLHEYVYEGVWQRYTDPPFRCWIWTVKDSTALVILTFFAGLLAISQSRSWFIMRFLLRMYRPVRLSDSDNPEPLDHLSQFAAIWHLLLWGNDKAPVESSSRFTSNSATVSPWFGILALVNCLVFFPMNAIIPYFLSEGTLETPIVRSKATESCLKFNNTARLTYSVLSRITVAEAIYSQCQDGQSSGCREQYLIETPNITKSLLNLCPFTTNICHNSSKTLQIIHSGITPYRLGVNSRSPLFVNHRVSCSPIRLEPFLTDVTVGPNHTWAPAIVVSKVEDDQKIPRSHIMLLETTNGPNFVSNVSSGLVRAKKGKEPEMTQLPHIAMAPATSFEVPWHPYFHTDPGMPFMVVYRAGQTSYMEQMDDPFFAAHNYLEDSHDTHLHADRWYADYEATALGCLEQFQLCARFPDIGEVCSDWGDRMTHATRFLRRLRSMGKFDDTIMIDYWIFQRFLPVLVSMQYYLYWRTRPHPGWKLPLRTSWGFYTFDNNTTQWMEEVEMWFENSLLTGRLGIEELVKFRFEDDLPGFEELIKSPAKQMLCGRILFRDGAFTNINWIGLWVTLGALCFICLVSLSMEFRKQIQSLLGTISSKLRGLTLLAKQTFLKTVFGQAYQTMRSRPVIDRHNRNFATVYVARFWYGRGPPRESVGGRDAPITGGESIRMAELRHDMDSDRLTEYSDYDNVI
jgi:hypothetical protein